MSVTREELQEAGASPELARILADRLPRRVSGDPTRNPMAVALAGIALAAFLSALGWLVVGVSDTWTEVALLGTGLDRVETRMTALEERMTGIEGRMTSLEDRMIRIESRLDLLLQE